jgi:hypothetical protein
MDAVALPGPAWMLAVIDVQVFAKQKLEAQKRQGRRF